MANFATWIQRRTGKRRKKRTDSLIAEPDTINTVEEHVETSLDMAQPNGVHRQSTPIDTSVVPPGRVISSSMMRQSRRESPQGECIPNFRQQLSNKHHLLMQCNGLLPSDMPAPESQDES